MLKGSFLARKHPVNVLRRHQLLDQLIADYRPSTTLQRSSCEMLAGILEQLETMKPGSPVHQRLVQLSQLLGAALEESRASSRVASLPTDYSAFSLDELAARAKRIIEMVELVRHAREEEPVPTTADGTHDTTAPVSC
jgi:hypothetical protein